MSLASGCTGSGGSTDGAASSAPSIVAAPDYLAVAQGGLQRLGVGPLAPKPDDAYLYGPDYTIAVHHFASAAVLKPETGLAEIHAGRPAVPSATPSPPDIPLPEVRAAAGHEFVIVELANTPTFGVDTGSHTIYGGLKLPDGKMSVRVGDVAPAPLGTLAGTTLVVSAPIGQPVTLLIDDVRPQSLDLRTGLRIQAVALWYPVLGQDSPSSLPSLSFRYSLLGGISASLREAVLRPATAGGGWAPAGQAWLSVKLQWVTGALSLTNDNSMHRLTLEPTTFALVIGGQALAPAGSTGASLVLWQGEASSPFWGILDLTFKVPESFRTGALRISPLGGYTDGKATYRISAQPAQDVPLSMTPLKP